MGVAEVLAGDEGAGAAAGGAEDRADEREVEVRAEGLAGDDVAGAAVGAAVGGAEDPADEREADVLAEGLAGDETAGTAASGTEDCAFGRADVNPKAELWIS